MPRALITGITGQDGLYLSEFLIEKGYEVYGLLRGQSNPKASLVPPAVTLLEGDLTDLSSLIAAVEVAQPDEVYNLGAISYVGVSWKQAELTAEVTGCGVLRALEACRLVGGAGGKGIKFYQASSSEMFGTAPAPQREDTPFHPRSPYGVAKCFGHFMTQNYRESYGLHASSGILFNHESPRRGPEFVTRKITRAVARIAVGLQSTLTLGNIDVIRDWGFAGDYVRAMWLMLQQDTPGDYVVGTGVTHTLHDVLRVAFTRAGLPDWGPLVRLDVRYVRPAEVAYLCADATRARAVLGWGPTIEFTDLIEMMVDADLVEATRDKT